MQNGEKCVSCRKSLCCRAQTIVLVWWHLLANAHSCNSLCKRINHKINVAWWVQGGLLWNDTQGSGRNWSYSAKVRKNRRNIHQVFKHMTWYNRRRIDCSPHPQDKTQQGIDAQTVEATKMWVRSLFSTRFLLWSRSCEIFSTTRHHRFHLCFFSFQHVCLFKAGWRTIPSAQS